MLGLKRKPHRGGEPDITPMIDVVFQLIIFFMVTSSFTPEQDFFEIILPKAKATQVIKEENTFPIFIDKDGVFYLPSIAEKKPVPKNELAKLILQNHKDKTILIKADRKTPYEFITSLLEILHGLGLESFSLGVEERT